MKCTFHRGSQVFEISSGMDRFARMYGSAMPKTREDPAASEPGAAPPSDPTRTWVKFKVVDHQTGQPIENVQFQVMLPSGNEQVKKTDAKGIIDIRGIPEGYCSLTSDLTGARIDDTRSFVGMGDVAVQDADQAGSEKAKGTIRIARLEEHKVAKGETLDSLAQGAGMTWQDLAAFNWDTSAPKEINEHLRDDVGCTNLTADGKNYRFDDQDDPGIIHVPRKWEKAGLATEKLHVIKVKSVGVSNYVIIELLDTDPGDETVKDYVFTLRSADGSYDKSQTVKDDVNKDNRYLELCYEALIPGLKYTFEVNPGDEDELYKILEDVSYDELVESEHDW